MLPSANPPDCICSTCIFNLDHAIKNETRHNTATCGHHAMEKSRGFWIRNQVDAFCLHLSQEHIEMIQHLTNSCAVEEALARCVSCLGKLVLLQTATMVSLSNKENQNQTLWRQREVRQGELQCKRYVMPIDLLRHVAKVNPKVSLVKLLVGGRLHYLFWLNKTLDLFDATLLNLVYRTTEAPVKSSGLGLVGSRHRGKKHSAWKQP